ncbi:hypothetical protein GCM10008927_17400 [Amylibacter ulvae]|uniref:Uncharacterized protein n=1 Tax=Paramylibacter ulvae TaxID=1651968 RepID=A0ABQ3D2A5_9RHOB|nr:hypothetical protein [Amylibacter ulvae]GHA52456.1 hypothetical protein GCM10008927_17400 [Amylibacter ulvae]
MNRRQFTQGLGAIASAPIKPLTFGLGGLTQSNLYERAVYYANLWDRAAPEMFMGVLNTTEDETLSIIAKLQSQNVISVPDENGFVRAIAPYWKLSDAALRVAQQSAVTVSNIVKKPDIRSTIERIIDEPVETDPQETAQSTPEETS